VEADFLVDGVDLARGKAKDAASASVAVEAVGDDGFEAVVAADELGDDEDAVAPGLSLVARAGGGTGVPLRRRAGCGSVSTDGAILVATSLKGRSLFPSTRIPLSRLRYLHGFL
jgi:hypothetical protein